MLDLPGSAGYSGGRTFVVDVPGPTPDAPTAVLLHGLGCTAYLCWFGCIAELSRTHRVVTFDQRWHGRGILLRPVPVRRLRGRRGGRDGRARDRPGTGRRLLDGRRRRPGAVAPAPGARDRSRARLDRAELPRPQAGEVLLLPDDAGHEPAVPGRPAQGREARARAAGRHALRRPRPGRLGRPRVPQHQRLVDARGARRARPVQLRTLDRRGRRAHGGRRHRPGQGDPGPPPAGAGRGDPGRRGAGGSGRSRVGRHGPRRLVPGVPRGRAGRDGCGRLWCTGRPLADPARAAARSSGPRRRG